VPLFRLVFFSEPNWWKTPPFFFSPSCLPPDCGHDHVDFLLLEVTVQHQVSFPSRFCSPSSRYLLNLFFSDIFSKEREREDAPFFFFFFP